MHEEKRRHGAALIAGEGETRIDDTCSACGERNPAGSQFCLFCGVYLGWEDHDSAGRSGPPGTSNHPPRGSAGDARGPDAATTYETLLAREAAVDSPVEATERLPETDDLLSCPACRHANNPERRFCSRCGTALHTAARVVPPETRQPWWRRWWQGVTSPEHRASRRAYRRSLPASYRWRRLLVSTLAVAVVISGLVIIGRNPAKLAQGLWHDLRHDVVPVEGVTAAAAPPDSSVAGTSPAAAVDGDPGTAWSTSWKAPETPLACGQTTGTGTLQLVLPPTRLREIRIVGGVTDPSQRPLQLLPKTLHVAASDGTCVAVELSKVASSQTIAVDTEVEVSSLAISVASTFDATDSRATSVVSLSEVSLWARPQ